MRYFSRDTRETISEASQLYLLAYKILGPRPQPKRSKAPKVQANYNTIKKELEDEEQFPPFLIGRDSPRPEGLSEDKELYNPNIHLIFSFPLIENQTFIAYWDRVEDRLYKIRNSLNFEGIFRSLALFDPPIDPAQLVAAAANGSFSSASAGSAGLQNRPHYRYTTMLEKARGMISNVIGLGGTLLSTLEKKDAESLALLQNTHESQILNLTTAIKEAQKQEAEITLQSLKTSLESTKYRNQHYKDLIDENISPKEIAQITLMGVAQALRLTSGIISTISSGVAAIPDFNLGASGAFGSPVATSTIGGSNISKILEAVAKGFETGANLTDGIGSIVGIFAGYERRLQDWQLQEKMAAYEITQIEQQIEAQQERVKMADQEIRIHEKSIEQNEQIADFYKSKFTNKELYNWMLNRIAGLYFQTYQLAWKTAKGAEQALQWELGETDTTYISNTHWDSLRKGLLAGESLMLDLNRMEKAYLDKNYRLVEIEKTVSLLRIDPTALNQLKQKGECIFELSEALYDRDHPGHYCRRIDSISVSIPSLIGPYQNIKGTLIQQNNKILIKDDKNALDYMFGISKDATSAVWSDLQAHQAIIVSRGTDDTGVLNFGGNDERYLPFEGTGAVSTWKLELPKAANQFDYSSITDVVIKIQYNAYINASSSFIEAVKKRDEVKQYTTHSALSLAQYAPNQWEQFKQTPPQPSGPTSKPTKPLSSREVPTTPASLILAVTTNATYPLKALELSLLGNSSCPKLPISSTTAALPTSSSKSNTTPTSMPVAVSSRPSKSVMKSNNTRPIAPSALPNMPPINGSNSSRRLLKALKSSPPTSCLPTSLAPKSPE